MCSTTQDFGVRIQTCDTFEAELIQCTISNVVTQDFTALVGCYENLGVYNHMQYVLGPVCRIDSSGNNSSILVLMVNVEVVTIFRIPFQTTLGSLAPKTTYSSFSCGSGMPQVDWTRLGLSTRSVFWHVKDESGPVLDRLVGLKFQRAGITARISGPACGFFSRRPGSVWGD